MAEFASKGVAGAGLGTGIAGLSLGVLNSLGNMTGFNGGMNWGGYGFGNGCGVNHYELGLMQELMAERQANAILAADNTTDRKLVEVYAKLETRDKEIRNELEGFRRHQEEINKEQAVYNGVNTTVVGNLKDQIRILQSLTKVIIPNESVVPGWDDTTP